MTNEYRFQVSILSKHKELKVSSANLKELIADFDKIDKSQIEWTGWNKSLFSSLGQAFAVSKSEVTESADIKHNVTIQLNASLVGGHFSQPKLRDSAVVIHLEEQESCLQSASAITIELFNNDHELMNKLFVPREDLAKFILAQLPKQLVYLDKPESLNKSERIAEQKGPSLTSQQHLRDKAAASIISQRPAAAESEDIIEEARNFKEIEMRIMRS